jgi:hypothetical protein
MEKTKTSSPFFKSTLTGLFTGILATVICLFFNAEYRNITYFNPAEIINVSSLIFAVNLLFLCIGIFHFFLVKLVRSGEWIYIVVFVLLTLWCTWMAKDVHRAGDPLVNRQFIGLLDGTIWINGVCAAVIVPMLFHSKKFEDGVLGSPEI